MARLITKPSGPAGPVLIGGGLVAAIAILALLSASRGDVPFEISTIIDLIWHKFNGHTLSGLELDSKAATIIWQIRFPRIITSILAGAALGLSGAIFQGLLLNPLADPYTLGVSSGAACGASAAILIGIANPYLMTAAAFGAALLTLLAVLTLALEDGRVHPTRLILAGVIIASILSAALSFQKYLAGEQVSSIVFWLMGSFVGRSWVDAGVILFFLTPALILALFFAVDLNVMTLGARSADTLGVNSDLVRLLLLIAASLTAAAAVSVSGVIGFVGLIIPHLIRLATGPDHRSLLPLTFLGGGLALLAADTVVRVVLPQDIPVGVLTALLAGPVFLVIFRSRMSSQIND